MLAVCANASNSVARGLAAGLRVGGKPSTCLNAIAGNAFKLIKDHVLLPWADALAEADALLSQKLDREVLASIVEQVPDAWLEGPAAFAAPAEQRAAYVDYLVQRLALRDAFVQEAVHART